MFVKLKSVILFTASIGCSMDTACFSDASSDCAISHNCCSVTLCLSSNFRQKSILLHSAGMEVQDIYFTLQERDPGEGETAYDVVVEILNNHFTPQINMSYQRSQFRAMEQKPSCTIQCSDDSHFTGFNLD
jgi:hypothetical protein